MGLWPPHWSAIARLAQANWPSRATVSHSSLSHPGPRSAADTTALSPESASQSPVPAHWRCFGLYFTVAVGAAFAPSTASESSSGGPWSPSVSRIRYQCVLRRSRTPASEVVAGSAASAARAGRLGCCRPGRCCYSADSSNAPGARSDYSLANFRAEVAAAIDNSGSAGRYFAAVRSSSIHSGCRGSLIASWSSQGRCCEILAGAIAGFAYWNPLVLSGVVVCHQFSVLGPPFALFLVFVGFTVGVGAGASIGTTGRPFSCQARAARG